MTIREFCEEHDACEDGMAWALKNCKTMDEVWATSRPEWLIWVATRPKVLDDKTLRLFACWSVRQVSHLLTDERSLLAIAVAELFAHGNATRDELDAARDAAWGAARDVARDATWAAARDAAWDAAWAAAWGAARAATRDADWDAAWAAARAAARDAARAATWAAARAAQAEWLRANASPKFSVGPLVVR